MLLLVLSRLICGSLRSRATPKRIRVLRIAQGPMCSTSPQRHRLRHPVTPCFERGRSRVPRPLNLGTPYNSASPGSSTCVKYCHQQHPPPSWSHHPLWSGCRGGQLLAPLIIERMPHQTKPAVATNGTRRCMGITENCMIETGTKSDQSALRSSSAFGR